MAAIFENIQGNIVPGFAKPLQAVLVFQVREPSTLRPWVKLVSPLITSAAEVAEFRRRRRLLQQRGLDLTQLKSRWYCLGFTSAGLKMLNADSSELGSPAFQDGLCIRAEKIDAAPNGTSDPSHPTQWLFGGVGSSCHAVVIIGCDESRDLADAVRALLAMTPSGIYLLNYEVGRKLTGKDGDNVEHFGYSDGISQPRVQELELLEGRAHKKSESPESLGGTGIDQFVLGHPQEARDPALHATEHFTIPGWARNGSFMVYRRLNQDVGAFRRATVNAAKAINARFGMEIATAEVVASRLFGRWKSGAPLMLTPDQDDAQLGADGDRNNAFGYGDDPSGLLCPLRAHIRTAYGRDEENPALGGRVLRRGIPFGAPYPAPGDRGLLFISFQRSIERQFERTAVSPGCPAGLPASDPLMGKGSRCFTAYLSGVDARVRRIDIVVEERFVIPTGGDYFFAPSLSAIKFFGGTL